MYVSSCHVVNSLSIYLYQTTFWSGLTDYFQCLRRADEY